MAVVGLLLLAAGAFVRGRRGAGTAVAVATTVLAALLAVVVPDMKVLALAGYLPMLLVLLVLPGGPEVPLAEVFGWPTVNLLLLTVAGLAFAVHAVATWRSAADACVRCGRRGHGAGWWTPERIARWGRVGVAVAVTVPTGYAVTRYAWALGIPWGMSRQTLEVLLPILWAGAGLATGAVVGAVLTTGLVRPWGERFPRWMPLLGARTVPVGLAVLPATVVSVLVMSAGLMFVRLGVTGGLEVLPGKTTDVAAWLPELFWPLWSAGLALATWTYWLRRRAVCRSC